MRKDNDSKKRILASLVMGLNCVNSFAPMAVAVNMEQPVKVDTKPVKETVAEPEQYTAACYQALDVVDSAIFGTAEAAFTENVGTAFATSSVNGETVAISGGVSVQNISGGGTASNGIINNGGTQNIAAGGKVFNGKLGNGGTQNIYSGGTGNLDLLSGNNKSTVQTVYAGGSSLIVSANYGSQYVAGGYASIGSVGGNMYHMVSEGGKLEISAMKDGRQYISNGLISVCSAGSGYQYISAGGTGLVDSATNGTLYQYIYSGGTGSASYASAGGVRQFISSGGTGTIDELYKGRQTIAGGDGTIHILKNGAAQEVGDGGTGIVDTMNAGSQFVHYGGTAITSDMVTGYQSIGFSGSGIINTMSGGTQVVSYGGTATVSSMSGGIQNIGPTYTRYDGSVFNAGTGTILSMSGGTQLISSGGLAINTNVSGGEQIVLAGANVNDNLVVGSGVQNISGTPNNLSNNIIQSGGVQNVSAGAVVTNQDIGVGGTQNVLVGGSTEVDSTVNIGGTQNVSGTVTILTGGNQVVSGLTSVATGGSLIVQGTQTVTTGGTALGTEVASGGNQIVTGGTATSTLLQVGAQQTIRDGLVTGQEVPTGATQQLFGGTVDGDNITGGTVELYNPSAAFNDVTMTDGLIRFGADGGTYNILGTFDFQDGTVDMVSNPDGHTPNPGTYETLNIANLQGNGGTFKLDIDLNSAVYGSENTYGDKIVITDGTPGTHYIQVADKSLYTGTEITGDRKLLLVTDLSGVNNLTYVGKDLNNGGVWHTLPPQLFKEGNKWYLGYIQKEASNDTTTYLTDRQVAVYNQWTRIANDSLRKRLGDLRYNDAEAGVWARYYRGKISGDNFDQSYNTYQVGIDKTSGQSTFGFAVEKQEASQSYGYGNGDGTTVAGNIYYTKYTDTGSYFDAILKYGKINSKYDTTGTFPDHADYDTKAYSLSLEYGKTNTYKNGFFVEPKVQLTYGHISAENYTTNRGTLMEESAIKSLIGKVGFVAGRKISDNSDYYFKAGIFREFKGDRDVHLAATNGENMYKSENYGDTWFEIGLGGNVKLAKNTHLYGDVEKSIGADIQKDWQFNVGVRWEF